MASVLLGSWLYGLVYSVAGEVNWLDKVMALVLAPLVTVANLDAVYAEAHHLAPTENFTAGVNKIRRAAQAVAEYQRRRAAEAHRRAHNIAVRRATRKALGL